MPEIKKGESRNDYVAKHEGLDQKAAVGKCEGMYSHYKKGLRKRAK